MEPQKATMRSSDYHARMQRVLVYIDEHLDEDLDVATLSGVAAFSKFHFQRQFSELFGVTPSRYVQLLRLKRASYHLAYRDAATVMGVALDSGYDGPEAFSRAFKRRLGQTPSDFKGQPDWAPWHEAYEPINQTRSAYMTQQLSDELIRIVDFPATPVAAMEHRGDPDSIGDTIRRFIAWRKATGLGPRTSATFNIFHSDPDPSPRDGYRMDLCAATDREIEPNGDGVVAGLIPAGRCAVLRMTGSSDDLAAASTYLYADWLPRSGEELRDFPFYAQRVSFFPDVPEHEAVTDLFLPLK
jgi:AraC family transcriptional regulator